MSTFSSILSSMSDKPRTSQQPSNAQKSNGSGQEPKRPNGLADSGRLTSSNAVAGVKRKSEEPELDPRVKIARLEKDGSSSNRSVPAPQNRFQLSAKPGVSQKPNGVPHRPALNTTASSNPEKPLPKSAPKSPSENETNTPPTVPQKRGFASIMERAKAAQEAAKAAPPSGIKHKAAEKLTKRERLRLAEEAKAQQKAAKGSKLANVDPSNGGTPAAGLQKDHETSYKGTMKKVAEPLSYKGTMRTAALGEGKEQKQKGQAQDKYGGYASWSDLDEAEDEEEEDYDSEASSDMEGGFDDVEREESRATRAARMEDQAFQEEEERLRREKLDRKRKLQELSKSAASRKKY